jgi:hypothetical protein
MKIRLFLTIGLALELALCAWGLTIVTGSATAAQVDGGAYVYAWPNPVPIATYRNLIRNRCVPLDSTWRRWACPDAPPTAYWVG